MDLLKRQQDAGNLAMAPLQMTSLSANPIAVSITITVIMVVVVTSISLFQRFNLHKFGWTDAMALIGMVSWTVRYSVVRESLITNCV
jgi:hypothetical protein